MNVGIKILHVENCVRINKDQIQKSVYSEEDYNRGYVAYKVRALPL
jgi:hypothetical protein